MTTAILDASKEPTDADLVLASRQGDREAFSKIVRRYQAMITGLIYASCGDLGRSEELAQDTFVSAWKSLSGLREPAKLPAWLCQVAKHRLLDRAREESRREEKLGQSFSYLADTKSASPDERLLSIEERELLWQTLREIPQPYRETLVLYYRQGQSVSDVALAMETSEANVRQRLARGREMLREQVAAMLERNLVRSAPTPAFALSVVAALPALVPQTTATAIGSAAVKGTAATAKATGLIALLAFWLGPIIGLVGGIIGTWSSIRSTEHPRERKYVVRMSVWVWIFVIVSMAILLDLSNAQAHHRWNGATFGMLLAGFWSLYGCILAWMIVVFNRRHSRIRQEVGLPPKSRQRVSARGRSLGFAGATIGALAWMAAMALHARDVAGVTIVVIAMIAATIAAKRISLPLRRYSILHVLALALFTLVMMNWKFHVWLAAWGNISVAAARERAPWWTLNLFIVVLYGVILMTVVASYPREQPQP